jgi:DNA-binding transcriptional regulator YiaG
MKKPETSKKDKPNARWIEGSVQDFLELSDADMELIETRLAASRMLRAIRQQKKLTQDSAARILKTSQSRFAKMEAGDASVSLDLLFRSLFALGVPRKRMASLFLHGVSAAL